MGSTEEGNSSNNKKETHGNYTPTRPPSHSLTHAPTHPPTHPHVYVRAKGGEKIGLVGERARESERARERERERGKARERGEGKGKGRGERPTPPFRTSRGSGFTVVAAAVAAATIAAPVATVWVCYDTQGSTSTSQVSFMRMQIFSDLNHFPFCSGLLLPSCTTAVSILSITPPPSPPPPPQPPPPQLPPSQITTKITTNTVSALYLPLPTCARHEGCSRRD